MSRGIALFAMEVYQCRAHSRNLTGQRTLSPALVNICYSRTVDANCIHKMVESNDSSVGNQTALSTLLRVILAAVAMPSLSFNPSYWIRGIGIGSVGQPHEPVGLFTI